MSDRQVDEKHKTIRFGIGCTAALIFFDMATSAIPAIRAFKTMKAIQPVVKVAKARKLGFRAK